MKVEVIIMFGLYGSKDIKILLYWDVIFINPCPELRSVQPWSINWIKSFDIFIGYLIISWVEMGTRNHIIDIHQPNIIPRSIKIKGINFSVLSIVFMCEKIGYIHEI